MSDIQEIVLNIDPEQFYNLSDKLFLKEYTYEKLYNELRLMPYMKKFFLYIIHYYNSFKGEKEEINNVNKQLKKPLKSLKAIYENNILVENFNNLIYYNDDKMTYNLYHMKGFSREYNLYLKQLKKELKDKHLEIYFAHKRLLVSKCLNNFLSDDLLESVCNYFITDKDIINKKNIRQNIHISIKNTKKYYEDNNINPDDAYCINWRDNGGIYGFYLPDISIRKYYQILPFIFNHEEYFDECYGNCEYCFYKIDYPRKMYLYYQTLAKMKGERSKFYNNWIFFMYNLCCTPGRSCSRTGFISIYDRNNKFYKKNSFAKYKSHPILKNNISNWKKLENVWSMVRYND